MLQPERDSLLNSPTSVLDLFEPMRESRCGSDPYDTLPFGRKTSKPGDTAHVNMSRKDVLTRLLY